MSTNQVRKLAGACLVGLSLSLTGCGDSPEKLVASAKGAIEKRDFNAASIQVKNALQQNPKNAEARFLFARVLMAQGDFVGGERELRKAREDGYKETEVLPLLVTAMINQGQATKAIAEFAGKQPQDPAARAALAVALGDAYLALQDTGNASKFYSAALTDASDAAPALIGQAHMLMVKEDASGALAAVNKVLDTHPKHIEAYVLKSDILVALGRLDEAATTLREATTIAPDDKQPLLRLVSIYLGQGKREELSKTMASLHKLAPNDARTVYFEGVVAMREGKYAEARDLASKVLRAQPSHDLAAVLAAAASLKLGDTRQAQNLLTQLVARRNSWALPRRLLAQAYIADKDAPRALEVLQPMLTVANPDPENLNTAAEAYMSAGDYSKAAEYYQQVAKLKPGSSVAHARLGMSRIAAGDDSAGIQELEAATKQDSADMMAQVGLISSYLKKGDTAKAKDALAVLEQKQPNNPATYNIKGFLLQAMKDIPGARKAFERSIELQPNNIGAVSQLARLDVMENKPADARARFEALTKKDPKNIRAYMLLAQLLDETKAPQADIRSAYERGISADTSVNDIRVPYVVWLLRNGDTKTALTVAQQAAAALPASLDAQRLLARTALAAGDKNQALSLFGKLQAAEPNNPMNLVELADAQRANSDIASAEKSLRSAISMKPDLVEAYERLAGILERDQRQSELLPLAQSLKKANPKSAVGYMLEADALVSQKRWPEASQALQAAYERSKTPRNLLGLRNALMQQGKTTEAQKLVADWGKAFPNDIVVRMALADEVLMAGKYSEALAQYKTLEQSAPNSALLLNNLAWAANKASDPKTVEYAERLLKVAPDVPAMMETAGTIFVEHDQAKRGLELIRKALEKAPDASAIRLGYARALAKTGDKSTAKSEATKALEGVPTRHPLRDEINAFIKTLS